MTQQTSTPSVSQLALDDQLSAFGLSWAQWQSAAGLQTLDAQFIDALRAEDASLAAQLLAYRAEAVALDRLQVSALLIAVARPLERFIAERFGITEAVKQTAQQTLKFDDLYTFREKIIARKVRRYRRPISTDFATLYDEVLVAVSAYESGMSAVPSPRGSDNPAAALASDPEELRIARYAVALLADERGNADALEQVVQWAKLGQTTAAGQAVTRDWMSFSLPTSVESTQLVPIETVAADPYQRQQWRDDHAPANPRFRQRQDFSLSDQRASIPEVQAEIDYCKYCHDHEGDFCARGFFDKKGRLDQGFREDAFGQALVGCPLEEKISEMQWLKREGRALAALAMAMADNPMIPATGHRICNDCMKACIYQKQNPVDVPQIETRVLTDVLALPWGAELYHLLRRWNPLRTQQALPAADNGKRVLIVGMGPAGFSLAHHLLMAGCTVVGVDGLKIEPISSALVEQPIREWSAWVDNLDNRQLAGFGGVAEYGITSRWDKNFLKLIYLSLARESRFAIHGGVRFGGTLTIDSAWRLGFDHIALATGAGHPKVLDIPNGLATGMRQANDFLMALQLTGAAKAESLAKLSVQLPVLVIGGGLTAVDAATEVGVYYLRQIERVAKRYHQLVAEQGEAAVRRYYTAAELATLDRYLAHAEALQMERARAMAAGESVDTVKLIRRWGGVTIVYRKRLHDSPAYRRNHEEIEKALQEGIYFREQLTPLETLLDDDGRVEAMSFAETWVDTAGKWQQADTASVRLPARSILVATGTVPNTVYAQEFPGVLASSGNHYLPHTLVKSALVACPEVATALVKTDLPPAFLTNYRNDGRFVSFLGDAHPQYQGTVVKAIASAQRAYPQILAALSQRPVASAQAKTAATDFISAIRAQLTATLIARQVWKNGIIELCVHAPAAAQQHQPGQIYRLQSYEYNAMHVGKVPLQLPPMALSVAEVAGEQIRLLISPSANQRQVILSLAIGEPIVLLGPSGAPIALPTIAGASVLLFTRHWGLSLVLELANIAHGRGQRVRVIVQSDAPLSAATQAVLAECCESVIWLDFEQDVVVALSADQVTQPDFWATLDYWHIGADAETLQAIQSALVGVLAAGLSPQTRIDTRLTSPMQCMLKGVCGQCLQWLVDPETGKRSQAIFTCAGQDQPLSRVDLSGLRARQRQDNLLAVLNRQWLALESVPEHTQTNR